jgi:hypothetical protein
MDIENLLRLLKETLRHPKLNFTCHCESRVFRGMKQSQKDYVPLAISHEPFHQKRNTAVLILAPPE